MVAKLQGDNSNGAAQISGWVWSSQCSPVRFALMVRKLWKAVAVQNSLLDKFSGKFRRCWKMIHRFSGSIKCYHCQGFGIFRQGKCLLEKAAVPSGMLLDRPKRIVKRSVLSTRCESKQAFREISTPKRTPETLCKSKEQKTNHFFANRLRGPLDVKAVFSNALLESLALCLACVFHMQAN